MALNDFEELVVREQAGVLRLAWALTGNPEDARDLAQEALVRAFTKQRLVLRAKVPRAYLRTIVLNTWRSQRRRPESPRAEVPDSPTEDAIALERQALVAALAQLPQQQRAVVALRHLDDLSVRETAAALGCSEQTVTTQTARALDRLRSNPVLRDLVEV